MSPLKGYRFALRKPDKRLLARRRFACVFPIKRRDPFTAGICRFPVLSDARFGIRRPSDSMFGHHALVVGGFTG